MTIRNIFAASSKHVLVVAGLCAAAPLAAYAQSMAAGDPMVGGAAMYPSRNIVQNAVNSKDHTTLVAAVKAAGLVSTLEGPGPFTVFAPTNEAFDKLPPGTVSTLVEPANKAELTKILTYHVVPGNYTETSLVNAISAGGGKAVLTTVEGEPLTVTDSAGLLQVTDAKGDTANITISNVRQSNGDIYVIDSVLMP
jgi:uncharacterized surface protein with fasciclin (FAS1) repeats